jgi:hypothetical protein
VTEATVHRLQVARTIAVATHRTPSTEVDDISRKQRSRQAITEHLSPLADAPEEAETIDGRCYATVHCSDADPICRRRAHSRLITEVTGFADKRGAKQMPHSQ